MSETPLTDTMDRLIAVAVSIYDEPAERAAMRGALGDAAGLCDALCDKILAENTARGHTSKKGVELAAVAKLAGDLIWQMREKVNPRARTEGAKAPAAFTDGRECVSRIRSVKPEYWTSGQVMDCKRGEVENGRHF